MPIAPALPVGGLAGFRLLERTFDRQIEVFSRSPDLQRDIEYFRANVGAVDSTEDLLSDRRLLRVALGAFGLEDQVGKTAFVRKVLDDGTIDPAALANRLADKSWARFSEAIGFGNLGSTLNTTARREEIVELYRMRQFESAIGQLDFGVGQALGFRRQIAEIATGANVDQTGWFEVMGDRNLRQVIEGAFQLPASFGAFDIDDQRRILEERSAAILGDDSPAVLADTEALDNVLTRFLITAGATSGTDATTRGATALTLLQSGGLASGARQNLFASLF